MTKEQYPDHFQHDLENSSVFLILSSNPRIARSTWFGRVFFLLKHASHTFIILIRTGVVPRGYYAAVKRNRISWKGAFLFVYDFITVAQLYYAVKFIQENIWNSHQCFTKATHVRAKRRNKLHILNKYGNLVESIRHCNFHLTKKQLFQCELLCQYVLAAAALLFQTHKIFFVCRFDHMNYTCIHGVRVQSKSYAITQHMLSN